MEYRKTHSRMMLTERTPSQREGHTLYLIEVKIPHHRRLTTREQVVIKQHRVMFSDKIRPRRTSQRMGPVEQPSLHKTNVL